MKKLSTISLAVMLLACTPTQDAAVTKGLATQPGQLFCSIQVAGGGSFIAALTTSLLAGALPTAAPLAVIATNAGEAAVNADCAKAAAVVLNATSGVPVSPPANAATVAQVSIVAPASPTVAIPK